MANLQVLKFAGAVDNLQIADGPPVDSKVIAAGTNGNVFGADGAPVICELSPIGGDATLTWPNGKVQILTAPVVIRLRGEIVAVA